MSDNRNTIVMMTSSQLKLTRKRRRQSIYFFKCVICLEIMSNVKLSKAMSVEQKSVLEAASPSTRYQSFLALNMCHKYYTTGVFLKVHKQNKFGTHQDNGKTRNTKGLWLSTNMPSMFMRDGTCSTYLSALFVRREHTGKTKQLHTIETIERDTKLKEAERRDEDMLGKISEEDLIVKCAVYHSTRLSSYLSKTNLKAKTPLSTVTT